jgi:hypothetical protein
MNKFGAILRITLLMLCGSLLLNCAHRPTVYIYGKYLSEKEIAELEEQLDAEDYQVKVNDLDFPTTISQNSILYSLLLISPESIDKTSEIAERMGMPVSRVIALTEGNHWYTKNSLAVFLFPNNLDTEGGLLTRDLAHRYDSVDCEYPIALYLYTDGSYEFIGITTREQDTSDIAGTWHYRQYPYLELKPTGSKFSTQYLQISQPVERDQVSEIAIIQLIALSSQIIPASCALQYGIRR